MFNFSKNFQILWWIGCCQNGILFVQKNIRSYCFLEKFDFCNFFIGTNNFGSFSQNCIPRCPVEQFEQKQNFEKFEVDAVKVVKSPERKNRHFERMLFLSQYSVRREISKITDAKFSKHLRKKFLCHICKQSLTLDKTLKNYQRYLISCVWFQFGFIFFLILFVSMSRINSHHLLCLLNINEVYILFLFAEKFQYFWFSCSGASFHLLVESMVSLTIMIVQYNPRDLVSCEMGITSYVLRAG